MKRLIFVFLIILIQSCSVPQNATLQTPRIIISESGVYDTPLFILERIDGQNLLGEIRVKRSEKECLHEWSLRFQANMLSQGKYKLDTRKVINSESRCGSLKYEIKARGTIDLSAPDTTALKSSSGGVGILKALLEKDKSFYDGLYSMDNFSLDMREGSWSRGRESFSGTVYLAPLDRMLAAKAVRQIK